MTQKFVNSVEVGYGEPTIVSSGSADAGKVVGLDDNGKVDVSVLPIAAIIPPGVISMWSGLTSAVPYGWAICDGSNNTPDLRDKFVVGAGNSYNVGATGGEAAHKLTADEMPSHHHSLTMAYTNQFNASMGLLGYANFGSIYKYYSADDVNGPFIGNTGGDGAHNNLPPYYALAYIMKL